MYTLVFVCEQIQPCEYLTFIPRAWDKNLAGNLQPGNAPGLANPIAPLIFSAISISPVTLSQYSTYYALFFFCLICTFFFFVHSIPIS